MTAAPLNVFQRLIRNWELAHPYNAAQVMTVARSIDPQAAGDAWEGAMSALGLGSVRLAGDQFRFENLNGSRRRYGLVALPPGTCLADHLSNGLNRPFDDPDEPPFRPFLLQESQTSRLGVVYQHWVADSVSVRLLLREWFCRLYEPAGSCRRPAAIAREGYWKLFAGRLRMDETALGLFRSHMRFRRVRKVQTPGPQGCDVRVALPEVPDGLIDALRSGARRHGVKVTDVLLAAVADACNRHLPLQSRPNRRDLAVGNIIDLRPHARGHLEGRFGLFLGFSYGFCSPRDLNDWPRLVRTIAMQSRACARNGVASSSTAWMVAALAFQRLVPSKDLYHFYRKEMPLTGGLSNVNLNSTWARDYHPRPLMDYLRVSPTGPMCPLVLGATTLGDRLRLAITYRQSLVDGAAADAICSGIVQRLSDEADRG